MRILRIMIVLSGVLFVGLVAVSGANTPEQQAARACNTAEAYAVSQTFVSSELRAPASAAFPPFYGEAVNVIATGLECEYIVHAHVDSQNGFGVPIRTKYQIRLIFDKAAGKWKASRLYFG